MEIFVTLFLIGLILSIIMIGLSFLGDIDMFGADIDVDLDTDVDLDMDLDTDMDFDGDVDGDVGGTEDYGGFSFLSPYMISFLLMGIGIGGTFLEEYYSMGEPEIFGGAFLIGVVVMLALQKMFRAFFVNTQVNSLVRNKDFAGAVGIVTLRIPNGDIGEVAVSTKVGRLKLAARSDIYIPEGTKVKVKEKLGNTLMVYPMGELPKNVPKEPAKEDEAGSGIGSEKGGASEAEEKKTDENKVGEKEEESEFTFEAYRKKEEAKKPTVIYDQRNIIIKDSVINRSDFSEMGENSKEKSPGELKKEMKKQIADELFENQESEDT